MSNTLSEEYRKHLAELLVAVQRCVYFLDGSVRRISWPVSADQLAKHSKEVELFMALSAVNERFSKLQDTLGAAMRHAAMLAGEESDTFIKTLSYFEKMDVLPSIDHWQEMRAIRNMAAHEYGTDYKEIADHFNTLRTLVPRLISISNAFSNYCSNTLGIRPSNDEFASEFKRVISENAHTNKSGD